MPEFIIRFDAGYGDVYEAIEAVSIMEAAEVAYKRCLEESEDNVDSEAMEYSEELAEKHGI